MNHKIVAASILFIMAFAMLTVPLSTLAASDLGVSILQITPAEAKGAKGTSVQVLGTIYTTNGSYQLFVGKTLVASGKADGFYIDANFTVPELPAASYALILRDVKINVNASDTFEVTIGYSASASTATIQEGSSATINVAVTGASLGTSYGAKVEIVSPSGTTYTANVALGTPNVQGTASKQLAFPSSDFTESGTTELAGAYTVKFNSTLATSTFNVNILDSTTYHRGQTVKIRATGYGANQAATVSVAGPTGNLDTFDVTASADGVIDTTWVVSSDAPIGECSVKISPTGTQKASQDKQTFTIVGYNITVHVTNLSGTAVPGLDVECVDSATSTRTNATTDANGVATFTLEKGDHGLTAYQNGVNVGQANITVTGDNTFTLRCQLSDMKITVQTENGIAMAFVDLDITYQYQSGSISRSGSTTGQTSPSGSFTLASTVAGATYTISASLYGMVFNEGNKTATSLSNQAITQVTIVCPSQNLTLDVTGYSNEAIPNARVELVELSNGLFYSVMTDSSGTAKTQATFGNYRLRIYKDNALISESTLQIFNATQKQIHATLYGIQLSVSVVDLFGSPITNADVTLHGSETATAVTEGNGVATFSNIIGGDMQIIAQVQGSQDASQAINVNVNQPTTVQIKLDKYVAVGGMLMQASTLITIIIVLIIAVLFVVVEVIRRKRIAKPTVAAPSAA